MLHNNEWIIVLDKIWRHRVSLRFGGKRCPDLSVLSVSILFSFLANHSFVWSKRIKIHVMLSQPTPPTKKNMKSQRYVLQPTITISTYHLTSHHSLNFHAINQPQSALCQHPWTHFCTSLSTRKSIIRPPRCFSFPKYHRIPSVWSPRPSPGRIHTCRGWQWSPDPRASGVRAACISDRRDYGSGWGCHRLGPRW